MLRTQVYLTEDLYSRLTAIAAIDRKPLAVVIRECLDTGTKKIAKKNPAAKNDLLELAKLNLTGGPRDLSANLDDYLYGDK